MGTDTLFCLWISTYSLQSFRKQITVTYKKKSCIHNYTLNPHLGCMKSTGIPALSVPVSERETVNPFRLTGSARAG